MQKRRVGGETYDPTIIAKLAIHQDRIISRTRERNQTHSYWYIPSAPRENYSLLVMESTGMMKMATGEGFPLRQGAGTSLDWLSVATEASGGGTPDILCSRMFLGYMVIYRRKKYARGPTRGPCGWRARPRGVGAPPTSWPPRSFPYVDSKSPGLVSFKNKFREVSGQLDSV